MKRDAIAYLELLDNANVRAFWHMIRVGEGTDDADGYRRLFGGELVDDLADHPRRAVTKKLGGRPITSTAAGAGQFLSRTWDECAKALGLRDFSPRNQDIAALFLIDRRRALDDVIAGRFETAVRKCNREWASLPESPYGQPVKTMAQARISYMAAGGVFEDEAAPVHRFAPDIVAALDLAPVSPNPEGETTMPIPAFAAAALPALISAIPKLGQLFGSGSEVSERNVKAAEMVVDIVTQAVGAKNAQEAAEIVASDPAAAQVARQAIQDRWFDLTEAGGGGIDGARKADAAFAASGASVWDSPSFWAFLVLAPLAYMIVGSVVGWWGKEWPSDVRAAIATAVVSLVVGGAAGYYWGASTSRNRAPAP